MGAWGTDVLENDSAADWFGGLFDETGLRDRVAAGLESNRPEEVRAAAWVVAQLGRGFVWPVEHIDEDRQRAIEALQALYLDDDWLDMWDDPAEVRRCLIRELRALGGTKPARSAKSAETKAPVAKKTVRKAKAEKVPRAAPRPRATKRPAVMRTSAKLTFDDGKSRKFWEIAVRGASYTVRFGRLGTDGQKRTTACDSSDDAKAAARRLIAEKLAKGYR